MDIRVRVFAIIFLVFASQGSVFAVEKDLNESEILTQMYKQAGAKGLPLTPKDNAWGEPNNGFITQLIPQSEEYIVGKPMKFGLVLKNISASVKKYDHQAISFKPLIIKTTDNNEPYDKIGLYSTMAGLSHSIDAGEIVTLFENRNITDEYVIVKPGKYTIQFRGGNYGGIPDSTLPASNIIEFEVKPGTPDERDLLVSLLVDILPDASWRVVAPKRHNAPAELKEEAISVILARGYKMDGIGVMLWQTKTQGAINDKREVPPTIEYLGKNISGYFYATIPPKALEYWPKIKEDIAKALKLDSQSVGLK